MDRDLVIFSWTMCNVLVLRTLWLAVQTMDWVFTTVATLKMLESFAEVSCC